MALGVVVSGASRATRAFPARPWPHCSARAQIAPMPLHTVQVLIITYSCGNVILPSLVIRGTCSVGDGSVLLFAIIGATSGLQIAVSYWNDCVMTLV